MKKDKCKRNQSCLTGSVIALPTTWTEHQRSKLRGGRGIQWIQMLARAARKIKKRRGGGGGGRMQSEKCSVCDN